MLDLQLHRTIFAIVIDISAGACGRSKVTRRPLTLKVKLKGSVGDKHMMSLLLFVTVSVCFWRIL